MLANTFGSSLFVEIHALIGSDGAAEQYPIFDEKGALLSHDGSHLTQAGARFVGYRHATVPSVLQLSATAAQ